MTGIDKSIVAQVRRMHSELQEIHRQLEGTEVDAEVRGALADGSAAMELFLALTEDGANV